jgi:hypothetical protein
MVYNGYFALGGTEIINTERTLAYVSHLLPQFGLEDCYECNGLHDMLYDHEYRTPMVDDAPWYDSSAPRTAEFLGLYPLSIEGVDSSVRMATVTESVLDGGSVGLIRQGTREMRVSALMLGQTEAGLAAGMIWLRYALLGNPCRDVASGCTGDDLCYFAACPPICADSPDFTGDIEDCIAPYARRMRNVTVTDGPRVVERFNPTCGAMQRVEFLMVAGVPWQYRDPEIVIPKTTINAIPPGPECVPSDELDPLIDPDCGPLPTPPRPPVILDECLPDLPYSQRLQYPIPEGFIPEWNEAVPVITIRSSAVQVRQVRLRFYPTPLGHPLSEVDPCSYCGEFVVSYLPAQTELVIDGTREVATALLPGGDSRNATQLLYGSDGKPFNWPVLTCGIPYIMTVDTAETGTPVSVDLSLAVRE